MMLIVSGLLAFIAGTIPTSGIVRDASTGAPLAGVVVRAVNLPGLGAMTGTDGRFTIDLTDRARLRFARVGYAGAEIEATPGDTLSVALIPAPQALEATTITALRGADEGPVSQTRRTQQDLEATYSGQDMPLLLSRLPSITATSDAGSESGYTYVRLRGLDQTRINVTLDGIPLNEPEDQGFYFSNFADFANSIQSVQVQRGVGTSSYGTASYAGAINFESIALAAGPAGGEAQLTTGSYGTRRVAAEYQTGLLPRRFAAYTRVSWQETDGYRRNAGNRSGSALVTAGYFGNRNIVKTMVLTGSSGNDMAYLPTPVEVLRTDRRFNPLTPDERDRFSQHLFSLSHTIGLGLFGSLATTIYHFRAGGDYDVRIAPDLWNFNLASQWTGVLTTAHAERGALAVDVGAHATGYRREHWLHIRPDLAAREYTNTGHKDEASGFVKLSADFAPILLVGDLQVRGARFRYSPDAGSTVDPRSIDWRFVNPKLGATARLSPLLSVYGSVGRTGREPTRNDMFAGFDNLDGTNIDFVGSFERVRPEYVTDVEAGATFETAHLGLRANGFWMEFRDEITPVGQLSYIGLPLRKNVDESTRRGVELDATLRAIPRLEGTFGASVMHSRIREYTDDATGITYRDVEPLLTPRFTAVHDLRYSLARWLSVSLAGHYASRSFLANTSDDRFVLPAAYVADAGLRLGDERRSLQLIVYNAGDSRGYSGGYTDGATSLYYPYATRHFALTARTTF